MIRFNIDEGLDRFQAVLIFSKSAFRRAESTCQEIDHIFPLFDILFAWNQLTSNAHLAVDHKLYKQEVIKFKELPLRGRECR